MRIAVDVRELCGRPTGVGRYLAGLFDAWGDSAAAARHDWTLYAHAAPTVPARWTSAVKVIAGGGGTVWEQLSLPRELGRHRPDVLFAPGYTAGLTVPAPVVQTIHDVSFFAHPEWFTVREGLRRRLLTAWSARRARAVITDSEFSKAEIVRHIGIPASRVRVIPLGIAKPGARAPADARSVDEGGPNPGSDQIVLFAGSIFERRNVDRLIQAFDHVADRVPGARLEIVGENRTRRPRLDLAALRRAQRHADRITIRSYVDEATLSRLYAHASVFAFLSEYEGFGFTPLEALAAGVAPVLLDTPIARETCGPAARYVGADADAHAIAAAIGDVLADAATRDEILRHAGGVLARYDWQRTAAQTLAAIEEAALAR